MRNNFSGWVGYAFTPSEDLIIQSLGRSVNGSISHDHEVKIWRASDQKEIAAVTVTSLSEIDDLGYAFEPLPLTVTLHAGETYRIASHEVSGGDTWRDAASLYAARRVASIHQPFFGASSYPDKSIAGNRSGYGPATFYYGGVPSRFDDFMAHPDYDLPIDQRGLSDGMPQTESMDLKADSRSMRSPIQ